MPIVTDERVLDVSFNSSNLIVDLMDGRTISVPLAWYPRLLHATPDQRANWEKAGAGYGIHWRCIDEDLSTADMFRGAPFEEDPKLRRKNQILFAAFSLLYWVIVLGLAFWISGRCEGVIGACDDNGDAIWVLAILGGGTIIKLFINVALNGQKKP